MPLDTISKHVTSEIYRTGGGAETAGPVLGRGHCTASYYTSRNTCLDKVAEGSPRVDVQVII